MNHFEALCTIKLVEISISRSPDDCFSGNVEEKSTT